MYRQAAAELGLSLADSYYVGDKVPDVTPAHELGVCAAGNSDRYL